MSLQVPSRVDALVGDSIEAAVRLKHRRRLHRLGWDRALEPTGDELWARGEPLPRPGCSLDVLIDGAEALPAMAEAIASAESFVHMTGWHVAPHFEITRGGRPDVLGVLLAQMAERVDVRVLVWAGAPVPLFHPTRSEVKDAVRSLTRDTRIQCQPDPREPPFHCHHEKTIVIDGRLAFVGGIDLTDSSGDRYDSSVHGARRNLGWHDVATRPSPAVADVHDHFLLRWKELAGETLDRPAAPPPVGEHTVQVVRTVAEDMYERVPRGDFRVLDTRGQLAVLADADEGDGLLAATIRSLGEGREDPRYVHAKVGIVDDRRLTIGSANLNAHSLLNDTEMNVVTNDPELARRTRVRLWAEHLELEESEVAAATRPRSSTSGGGRSPPSSSRAAGRARRRRIGCSNCRGSRVAREGCSALSRASSTTAEADEPYDPGVEPVRSNPVQDFPSAAQIRRDRVRDGLQASPLEPPTTRLPPPPLHGGALGFLRFARRRGMLRIGYATLILRWAWLKLRWRGRLRTDGLCFVCPNVKFEIGKNATVSLGRWSWLGHGTKIRAHEGSVDIGAKTVLGQECTISAYQHVSIGRECIVADRVMLIDFDHGVVEVERPIREQGIYKRDVNVGHNVWIGYGACVLRGVTIGDNCVVGTSSVVTKDLPDNAVAAGAPARVVRKRAAPRTFRWG